MKSTLVEDFLKNYLKFDSILLKVEQRGMRTLEAADNLLNHYLKKSSALKKQALEYRSKKP